MFFIFFFDENNLRYKTFLKLFLVYPSQQTVQTRPMFLSHQPVVSNVQQSSHGQPYDQLFSGGTGMF